MVLTHIGQGLTFHALHHLLTRRGHHLVAHTLCLVDPMLLVMFLIELNEEESLKDSPASMPRVTGRNARLLV